LTCSLFHLVEVKSQKLSQYVPHNVKAIVHHNTTNSIRKGFSSTLCNISVHINFTYKKHYYNIMEKESTYCQWDCADQYLHISLVLLNTPGAKQKGMNTVRGFFFYSRILNFFL